MLTIDSVLEQSNASGVETSTTRKDKKPSKQKAAMSRADDNIEKHTLATQQVGYCGRFGRGASRYCHRSQLFGRLWVRLSLPTGQFFEI